MRKSVSSLQVGLWEKGFGRSLLAAFLAGGCATAQTWVQLNPTGQAPDAVSNMNAAYDTAMNKMIVFGGGFIPRNNATSLLSNANGLGSTPAWTSLRRQANCPPPDLATASCTTRQTTALSSMAGLPVAAITNHL